MEARRQNRSAIGIVQAKEIWAQSGAPEGRTDSEDRLSRR